MDLWVNKTKKRSLDSPEEVPAAEERERAEERARATGGGPEGGGLKVGQQGAKAENGIENGMRTKGFGGL